MNGFRYVPKVALYKFRARGGVISTIETIKRKACSLFNEKTNDAMRAYQASERCRKMSGMMAKIFYPSTWRMSQEDYSELETNLGYIAKA